MDETRRETDLDPPGDLDVLIKRFMNLKDGNTGGPDLDESFEDDDLFKQNHGNTSTCDYQWFNDEIGFGAFGDNETGTPLCIGINTDYDVANIDMDGPCRMGMFKLSPEDPEQQREQGEGIASITGSILQHLAAYEDSTSGQESPPDLNNSMEMSICKSENLFSPLADAQPEIPALSTFSTDSLDVRNDILANCIATNTHNYTIAFNGNNLLDESYTPFPTTTGNTQTGAGVGVNNSRNNNNGSSNDSSWTVDNFSHLVTQSCPNGVKKRIFDLRKHRNDSDSEPNSSGSSIPMSSDESMHYVAPKIEKFRPKTTTAVAEIIKKSIQIQTSVHPGQRSNHGPSGLPGSKSSPVYICYPNYTLPDLKFLNGDEKSEVYLIPTNYKVPMRQKTTSNRSKRPMSCNDIEELKSRDLSHIKDWPSLNFLLPESYRTILRDINPRKTEENNEDEKSAEGGLGLESNSPVVLRKKPNTSENLAEKRYSLNNAMRAQNSKRYSKRFSLQEPIIPEINEITNEINKNLQVLNEMDSDLFGMSSCADSSGSGSGIAVPVPQNTPKISFIENNETITLKTIQNSVSKMSRMQLHYVTEKQGLTDAIAEAVNQIQSVVKPTKNTSSNLIIFSQSPAGRLVLESLCPALYSLLSDGLCPFLDTIFGKIPNTVWRVIEASIQYGPTAQTLNELVMKINSEESLAEGPMKFNAFVCGLLNLGNLASWLLFLRTKERLLRTHYDPEGLLFLCNTSTRSLYDSMVENVNYLTKLPFQLDIFHEVKVLHQSISSNKGKMRSASASATRKQHSNVDSNKLTHEVSNRTPSSKYSKYYVNQLKKTQMKRSFSDERPNSSKVQIGSSIPKSKTSQNILIDKNEKHYTSAPKLYSKYTADPSSKILRVKCQEKEKGVEPMKNPPRPKSLGTLENDKDSEKFRNLRMQWELLASDEKSKQGLVTSPGFNTGSKIPRPVNSPIKNFKEFPQQKFTKR